MDLPTESRGRKGRIVQPSRPPPIDVTKFNEDEEILGQLLLWAEEAREHPAQFLEFCYRDEQSQQFVKVLPHQRLMLDFAEAHDKCLIKIPKAFAKTSTNGMYGVWLSGHNPTIRGAIVSGAQEMAAKVLRMMSDYITSSPRVRLVFPELQKSRREGDPWTQTKIVVDRPAGIRDASFIAVGVGSEIVLGSRYNWVLLDDVVTQSNSDTPDKRQKMYDWVTGTVLSRMDAFGSWRKITMTNTPWYQDDLVWIVEHDLMWPTLDMRANGEIRIINTDWDSDLIRPERAQSYVCRLVDHDPDPENKKPLWPSRWSWEAMEEARRTEYKNNPAMFNRVFFNQVFDNETALCKLEYVEACKERARKMGISRLLSNYKDGNTFMGVDLAFGEKKSNDRTAISVFTVSPQDQTRILLYLAAGHWSTDEALTRVIHIAQVFNALVTVENNGAQKLFVDFLRRLNKYLPMYSHTTTQAKANPIMGVPAIFAEMAAGAWAFPNIDGIVEQPTQDLIDDCLAYAPGKHTGDLLMSLYFARERAQKVGALTPIRGDTGGSGMGSLRIR